MQTATTTYSLWRALCVTAVKSIPCVQTKKALFVWVISHDTEIVLSHKTTHGDGTLLGYLKYKNQRFKDYFVTFDKYLRNDSVTVNYEKCTVLSINCIWVVEEGYKDKTYALDRYWDIICQCEWEAHKITFMTEPVKFHQEVLWNENATRCPGRNTQQAQELELGL